MVAERDDWVVQLTEPPKLMAGSRQCHVHVKELGGRNKRQVRFVEADGEKEVGVGAGSSAIFAKYVQGFDGIVSSLCVRQRPVLFCFVFVLFCLVWFGLVWFRFVWFGMVWFGFPSRHTVYKRGTGNCKSQLIPVLLPAQPRERKPKRMIPLPTQKRMTPLTTQKRMTPPNTE